MKKRLSGIDAHGFTLLELTISITMLALIIVIILGSLRIGMRSVESGETKIESLERTRSSFAIIDSQIQSFCPISYDDEGIRKYFFRGTQTVLQLPTNYSIWGGERGYVVVSYSVISDDMGRQRLSVSEHVLGQETGRETILFDEYENIYFEYFSFDPFEETGKWVREWEDNTSLPWKIRLHFLKGPTDLALTIPLRVKGPSSGEFGIPEDFETE